MPEMQKRKRDWFECRTSTENQYLGKSINYGEVGRHQIHAEVSYEDTERKLQLSVKRNTRASNILQRAKRQVTDGYLLLTFSLCKRKA